MNPKVQIHPEFKAGDTLETHTGESFVVEKVTKAGYLCRGRAGILPKTAARKPLTEAQKAELAADDNSARAESETKPGG